MKKHKEPPPADVMAVRRANLTALVQRYETRKNLGQALGHTNGSFISQLLSDPPKRVMSEKVARRIESQLGLAPGFMDMVRSAA